MKNITLKTAQALALHFKEMPESEKSWVNEEDSISPSYKIHNIKWRSGFAHIYGYPAYSWQEILIDHAKFFFGEKQPLTNNDDGCGERICLHCGVDSSIQPPHESGCNHAQYPDSCDICRAKAEGWEHHTEKLLPLLQQEKHEEAEAYLLKNLTPQK